LFGPLPQQEEPAVPQAASTARLPPSPNSPPNTAPASALSAVRREPGRARALVSSSKRSPFTSRPRDRAPARQNTPPCYSGPYEGCNKLCGNFVPVGWRNYNGGMDSKDCRLWQTHHVQRGEIGELIGPEVNPTLTCRRNRGSGAVRMAQREADITSFALAAAPGLTPPQPQAAPDEVVSPPPPDEDFGIVLFFFAEDTRKRQPVAETAG
jgi:hypothetical protein